LVEKNKLILTGRPRGPPPTVKASIN